MRPSTALKHYHVAVEGTTVMVNAGSVYFAALVYNAMASCAEVYQAPVLTDSTVLRIRAVGDRAVHQISWRHVLDWAHEESQLVFGGTPPIPDWGGTSAMSPETACSALTAEA
jgi:hypothetical protein